MLRASGTTAHRLFGFSCRVCKGLDLVHCGEELLKFTDSLMHALLCYAMLCQLHSLKCLLLLNLRREQHGGCL
jgi:hypothetical protein